MEKITEIYFHSLKILFKAPDFKKSIDNFYISKISEFESRKNQSNFKEYLNNQHKEISQTFFQNKRLSKLHPKLSNEIEFVCVTMESLLHQIDVELNRLEHEKAQSNKKGVDGNKRESKPKSPKILAFNNDVEASLNDIRIILADINKLLFDDSTIEQWEKILNLETLETPIIVKNGIALNGLSKFFEALSIIGVFKKQWQTKLSLLNAFKHNTEFITADQFKHALNDGKSNGTAIDRHLEKIFFEFKNETDIDKNLDELLSPPPKHKF